MPNTDEILAIEVTRQHPPWVGLVSPVLWVLGSALIGDVAFATATPASGGAVSISVPSLLRAARLAATPTGDVFEGGLKITGTVVASGLKGRMLRIEDLSLGRWAETRDFGAFRSSRGDDLTRVWKQDFSGALHPLNSEFAIQVARTDRWLVTRSWLRPNSPGTTLDGVYAGHFGSKRCDAIMARPDGGQPVELCFDLRSHLLVQTVRVMPIRTVTTQYSNYRKIEGMNFPTTITTSLSTASTPEVIHITHVQHLRRMTNVQFGPLPIPTDVALAGATTVPIRVRGLVIVTATLDERPYEFILDTGGQNIITPEVARELGLKPVGSGTVGGSGSGTLKEGYTRIKSVKIGDAVMTDQAFSVIPLPYGIVEQGPRPALAGILGLELFERFAVQLNYSANTLTLSRSIVEEGPDRARAIPIAFFDDIPLVTGSINGLPGLFAIDTGNASSVVIQHRWAEEQGLAEGLRKGIEITSYGAGGSSTNWVSYLDQLNIGPFDLQHVDARYAEDAAGAFSSRTEAANIGTNVLSRFTVAFDYSHGSMSLVPVSKYNEAKPFNRAGLGAQKPSINRLVVTYVLPASPAAQAGIEPGDDIVIANGQPVDKLSGYDVSKLFNQPSGTSVSLRVRHGAIEREVSLVLGDYHP